MGAFVLETRLTIHVSQGIMESGGSMITLSEGMLAIAKQCLPDKCRCGGAYRSEVRLGRVIRMCPECRDWESYSGLALSFAHERARHLRHID